MQEEYRSHLVLARRLRDKLIKRCPNQFCVDRIQKLSDGQFLEPIRDLEEKHWELLKKRLNEQKTLKQIGDELGKSYQRVWQIEQEVYEALVMELTNTTRVPHWKDKPLIKSPCCDQRSIEFALENVPTRTINYLKKGDYGTMDKLCRATPNDLLAIRGIGKNSLKQIEEAVKLFEQKYPQYFSEGGNIHWGLKLEIIDTEDL